MVSSQIKILIAFGRAALVESIFQYFIDFEFIIFVKVLQMG